MSVAATKIASLVRRVERAREERAEAGDDFRADFTRQDAAILNVLRACEAAVDLANMLIRKRRLGLPSDMRSSFALLEQGSLITPVEPVIATDLDDLLAFAEEIRQHLTD